EDAARLVGTSRGPHLLADVGADALHLLVEDLTDELYRDAATIVEARLVADPLPDLRAADLGCGRVLHQVVDGGGAPAGQPEGDVAEGNAHVCTQPSLGERPRRGGDIQQRRRVDSLLGLLAADLVGL